MIDLHDTINNIKSKEELIDFLDFLSKDTSSNKKEWQNEEFYSQPVLRRKDLRIDCCMAKWYGRKKVTLIERE